MSAGAIYTVGNGKRTQCAMRVDGVWFMRTRWRNGWSKWREHGTRRPFEFGMYLAPRMGKAVLPSTIVSNDEPY